MYQSFFQKGRTLLETIGVIVLMAIVSVALYAVFHLVLDKANARTLEQEVQTRIVQLRHQALTKTGIKVEAEARMMEASGLEIRTSAESGTTFTLRVGSDNTPLDYSLCQRLMKSATFSPENLDACRKGQNYADFVFPKYEGMKKFSDDNKNPEILDCKEHAHQSENRCVCDAGYYGDGQTCTQCGDGEYSFDDWTVCGTCTG